MIAEDMKTTVDGILTSRASRRGEVGALFRETALARASLRQARQVQGEALRSELGSQFGRLRPQVQQELAQWHDQRMGFASQMRESLGRARAELAGQVAQARATRGADIAQARDEWRRTFSASGPVPAGPGGSSGGQPSPG